MGWTEAILLAIVQGLTEFLPVSSSGHLVLGGALLGMQPSDVVLYTVILHLASAAAIAVAYRKDWLALLKSEGKALWLPIIVGTVPAALIGVLFEDAVEEALTSPLLAAAMLLVTAAMLLVAQATDRGERTVEEGGLGRAVGVGLAQALAMLPGISRSGSCLATGIYAGFERTQAVRFAFLLGLPIICGAGGWKLLKIALGKEPATGVTAGPAVAGFIVCALVSFAAIKMLQWVVAKRRLWVFSVWCVLVGVSSLVWLLAAPPQA